MDMQDVLTPMAISVITFLLWYFLSDSLAKIFLWISIVMIGRTVCNLICVQSTKSAKEQIQHDSDSAVNKIHQEITQAKKELETSTISMKDVEKKISAMRSESQQRLALLANHVKDNDKLLKMVKKARDKAKSDIDDKLEAYKKEMMAAYEKTLQERNKCIEQMRESQGELIKRLQKSNEANNITLENKAIRLKFEEAIQLAEKELDIFSPWMNFNVIDTMMQDQFRRLLAKGVIIKIRYGIGELSSEQGKGKNRSDATEKVAAKLKQEFRMYPNFKMYRDNSHAKLFICDDKFYVISSFNSLSFKGDYTGDDMRREIGEYSTNKEILDKYRKTYFKF